MLPNKQSDKLIIIHSDSNNILIRPDPGKCCTKNIKPFQGSLIAIISSNIASITENGMIFDVYMDLKKNDTFSFSLILPHVVYYENNAMYNLYSLHYNNTANGYVFYINPISGMPVKIGTGIWTKSITPGYTTYSVSQTMNDNILIEQLYVTFHIPKTNIYAQIFSTGTVSGSVPFETNYIVSQCTPDSLQ